MGRGRATVLKNELEQEIVTGRLKPGERLEEMSLAERFGVSRTPVREALNRLASIGLVEIRPRRGAVVASIGIKEMMEMFEVMAELESMCGRLAARRMTQDEYEDLKTCHAETKKYLDKSDHDGYYAANVCFHDCIYRGSHNTYLTEQARNLRNRLSPYRRLGLRPHHRLEESYHEHEEILEAIIGGDEEKAGQLLSKHVTEQRGSFNDFISNLPAGMLRETG